MVSDWKAYVHPEGRPYYHNQALNLVTHADIANSNILELVMGARQEVLDLRKRNSVEFDDTEYELVIEPKGDRCLYYYADHKNELVFWVDSVIPSKHFGEEFNSDTQCRKPSI